MVQPQGTFEQHRARYEASLRPLILPANPVANDIVQYFASLLRVSGMEDKGWDPHEESRQSLNDLNHLMHLQMPPDQFPDPQKTQLRLGLIMYSHIVEMNAHYDVIANLLRFRLAMGFAYNPYWELLTAKEQKKFPERGIGTGRKIELIKKLSKEAGSDIGDVYDEFYNSKLRNAVQHSDFILDDQEFRSRSRQGLVPAFRVPYDELDQLLTRAKAFISAFWQVELETRAMWGFQRGRGMPYDLRYKGLLEVLVDERDLLCGFSVHWPNNSASYYRRTEAGVEMVNCHFAYDHGSLELFVGLFAQNRSPFSPLVEAGSVPLYTAFDRTDVRPTWPID